MEFEVGQGSSFKGKKLKQFPSIRDENTNQEAAQILAHNDVYEPQKYRLILIYFEA